MLEFFKKIGGTIKLIAVGKKLFDELSVKIKAAQADIDMDDKPEYVEILDDFQLIWLALKRIFGNVIALIAHINAASATKQIEP